MRQDLNDRPFDVRANVSRIFASLCLVAAFAIGPSASAQAVSPDEASLSEEEKREQLTAQRFLQVLLRRPNTGTSLDRVFGYHIGRGDLGELIDSLSEAAESSENEDEAGRHWMVVGLLQLQRGEDAAAIRALAQAEERLQENPLAAYYHGQALLLVGRNDDAAAAMQRALDLKPPRQEFLRIAGQLGRLYQRDGRAEDALAIWEQLEDSFPGDDGVRQRIARVMMEEGDTEGALARFDSLAKSAKTPNDQIVYALKAAELRIRSGGKDEAIAALEGLLKKLRPGSYLYDEARRRIEAAFLENGDYAGLAEYYTQWVEKNGEDVDAMVRLARTLSIQGRGPESITWFEKAIDLAPSDGGPRLALINAYVAQQKYSEAAGQYEALVELEPGNPDHLVRWGQLLLDDQSTPKEERGEAAAEVWLRLAESRSDDAVIQSQVADLMRGCKLQEQAIERYRAAIKLSPEAPQYKEYLGEYLHQLDRKDEAVEVWRSLAAGDLRTRANLVRLAEVLNQFERREEGLDTMAGACEMDPTIEERLRYAKWLRDAEKFDESLQQIELAAKATENLDERERVFAAEVETYQTSGRLDDRIEIAKNEAESAATDDELWRRLAVLFNAKGQARDAVMAIEKALEAAPKSIEALVVASQLYEDSGQLRQAIEKRIQLAESDPRFKAGHLQKLASLHIRVGETEQAIEAGKQLLAASNGTVDAYRFYANLCGQIGRLEERLDTLRRCARANPRDDEAQRMLASQLAEDFKTEQAIELYWNMFDGARDIDGRRQVVTQLADLYLRTNRLDQLIARLEIRGRESGDRRGTVDLISTAHQQVGDLGLARQALEGLLQEGGRDTMLMERLVSLAEQTGEYEEAVRLQRQLTRLAPDRKNESRLASLLIEIGEMEEAQSMWMRLAESNADPAQLKRNVNRLFAAGESKTAIELAQRVLQRDPSLWETRFQLMVLQAEAGDWEAAAESATALRALELEDTTAPVGSSTQGSQSFYVAQTQANPEAIKFARIQNIYDFMRLVDTRYGYSNNAQLPKPMDFGHAKVLALYCQFKHLTLENGDLNEKVEEAQKAAEADDAGSEEAWRWYETLAMADSVRQTSTISPTDPSTWGPVWRIVEVDDKVGSLLLSQYLANRGSFAQRTDTQVTAIDEDGLKWLKSRAEEPQDDQSNWVNFYASELRIAGDNEKADQYLRQRIDESLAEDADPKRLATALQQAFAYTDDDRVWPLIARVLKEPATKNQAYYMRAGYLLSQFTLAKRVTDKLSAGPDDAVYRERVFLLADHMVAGEAQGLSTRRAVRLTGVGGARNSYQLVGNSYEQINIEFPPKGLGPSDQMVQSQYGTWKQLKDHSGEWISKLRSEIDAEADPRATIWRQILLASLHQWEGRTEQALKTIAEATELSRAEFPPMEPELRLMSADLLLRQNRKSEALKAIDSLSVYDQQTMAVREFAAARLAAQIGDVDRATLAARRLFGVRLNAGAQIELAKLMRKLGMHQLASDLVRRMQNRGGRTTEQMQSLMTYFAAQGDKEQAAEVAMALLRRSAPKRRRSNSNYQTADDMRRRNALQTIATAGKLTPLIKATEERLENAPKSQKIRSELSEMYLAAGQKAKSLAILGGTDLEDVNSNTALEQTAQQFVAAGKMDEACDAYLKLLRRKQDSFNQQFYEIKRPFDDRRRLGELADLIIEVGLPKFTDHRVSEICSDLIRDEKNLPKARALYAAMLERPTTTNSMYGLSNIMGSARSLLTDTEMVRSTADFMIETSVKGSAWQTLFNGYSTSNGGVHNNAMTYFTRHVAQDEENVKLVEGLLREKLAEKEDWLEGKIWLGLLLTSSEQYDEAIECLKPLTDEKTAPKPTRDCIWLVGSLIDTHAPMQPLAKELYTYALDNTTTNRSGSEFTYTFEGRVSRFMADIGEKRLARDLVLKAIAREPDRQYSQQDYAAYQKIQSTLGVIEFLTEIDFAADAFKLTREFDRSLFAKARRFTSSNYESRFKQKEEELLKAVQKLGGLATARTMIAAKTEQPHAVDLSITFQGQPFTGEGFSSLWIELVQKAAAKAEEADAFEGFVKELKTLADERPDDDSVRFASAISSDLAGDPTVLRQLVQAWKADDANEVEVTDVRFRGRAFLLALLHLHQSQAGDDPDENVRVAESIRVEELQSVGNLEKSYFFAAMGQQVEDDETIKQQWRRAIGVRGNQWLLFDLSEAAAKRGFKQIATDAFDAAIEAPQSEIEDAPQTAAASSLGQLLSGAQSSSSPQLASARRNNDLDPEAVRLATRVFELDNAWREAKIYTKPVYEPLIRLTVAKEGGPRALCTPVDVKNNQLQVDSVFDRLAKRAHWSKRTDDLLSRLGDDDVPSNLMAAIALLRDERGEEALERYQAIDASQLGSVPKELALQTILLGFKDPTCRKTAVEIALALIDQNRPTGRYEDVEPFDKLSLEIVKIGLNEGLPEEIVSKATTSYLELCAHENDRYSGSSRITRRLPQLEEIAKLLLPKGRIVEAMNYLAMRQEAFDQGYDRSNDWVGAWALESFNAMKDRKAAYQQLADATFQGDGALTKLRAFVRRQPLPDWIPDSVAGGYPAFPKVVDPDLPIATNFSLLAQLAQESGQGEDLLKRLEVARSKERGGAITASAIAHAILEEPIDPSWIENVASYVESVTPSEDGPSSAAPLAPLQLASLLSDSPEHHAFADQVSA
ncbi:MAG: tetratricopeptide repeat protein, partial [Planctomycetota bacterium]